MTWETFKHRFLPAAQDAVRHAADHLETPSPLIPLLYRMVRVFGLDLGRLERRGDLSSSSVERMDHHCLACSDDSDCARRLAQHERTGQTAKEMPPNYCPNRNILLELASREKKRRTQ